jgi:hypothetical protein
MRGYFFKTKHCTKARVEGERERMRGGAKQATKCILAISLVLGYSGCGCGCGLTCMGKNIR